MTVVERFLVKVDKTNECWEWQAHRDAKGYGKFHIEGKCIRTHRVSWTLFKGIIPDNLCVLHHCDNPPCVNPDHLFIGTHKDNMDDSVRKGRRYEQKRTHCPQGHPYSNENLYKRSNGWRQCKTCMKAAKEKHRLSKSRTIKRNQVRPYPVNNNA